MSATKTPAGPPIDLYTKRPSVPPSAGLDTGPIELRLVITDPEVAVELGRRSEGPERERYALAALRLGVLALRAASGQVDGAAIREAGDHLLGDLRELLALRATEISRQLGETLTRYLDPQSGLLPRRLEALVKSDGELERLLRQHLGGDESTLARTLASHIGQGSPIFRLLAPDDANGLRKQVEGALQEALAEQRRQILAQFSLDNRESALSRLVLEMRERQTQIQADVKGQVELVVGEFSLDRKDSALSRLVERVEAAQRAIGQNLTLDDETSALSRLRRELQGAVQDLSQRQQEFQTQVRETLAALQARREEAAKSTRHGATFEDALGALLGEEAQRLGDVHTPTGNTTGTIKNCKIGDHVTQLGPDCQAAGARVAWEAKEDRAYDLRTALAEIEEARKNRSAQVGVFVFSRKTAPAGLRPFARYAQDLVVVWDPEDPATDVYVTAAYSVARALVVRERSEAEQAEVAQEIESATRAVEKQIAFLDDVRKWAETARSSGDKIAERAARMMGELKREVDRLDAQVVALRTGSG